MSATDIRFDCRFCNKPVNVAAKYAGKKVKCPACKNPVVVPGQQGAIAQTVGDAGATDGLKRVRGAAVKGGGGLAGLLGSAIKLGVLAAVLYAGYLGYGWYQGQSKKSLAKLLSEMAKGDQVALRANAPIVSMKVSEALDGKKMLSNDKTASLIKYHKHEEAVLRSTVATELGRCRNKKARTPLLTMLKTDKDPAIRREAAISLGELGWELKDTSLIEKLIDRMGEEKDQTVVGGIHQGLRMMTDNTEVKAKASSWKTWWGTAERGFAFPKVKPKR